MEDITKASEARILLVEDDSTAAETCSIISTQPDYHLRHVKAGFDALHELSEHTYQVVLLDLGLPDGTGFDVLDHLRPRIQRGEVAVIVIMSRKELGASAEAMRKGAHDFLVKPFGAARLLDVTHSALESFPRVGTSQAQTVDTLSKKILAAAAHQQAIVFMTGASHENKATASQKIHGQSSRKDADFVALDCTFIPQNSLETEIFGDEGAIARAAGGTLFLDEIDSLPLHLQRKLLYFLKTKGFQALPSGALKEINCRVICGASHALAPAVDKGKFDKRLYDYLCTKPLTLPNFAAAASSLSSSLRAIQDLSQNPGNDQPKIMVHA